MPDILSFISSGIIGGFVGAFLGGFAKFFWENWLPGQLTWRREQKIEREKLLSQFRDPAITATADLQSRIFRLLHGGNYEYLQNIGMQDYYILSTAFLVAQFFGWVELLLQKMSMLDYSELTNRLEKTTESFSHGTPGFQIFRLEQRELGQRMLIQSSDSNLQCLGYAEFVDMVKKKNIPSCFIRLREIIEKLLGAPENEMARLTFIQNALVDLIIFLDPEGKRVPEERRSKFDLMKHLEEQEKQLSPNTYNKIIHNMQVVGLIDETTANQKLIKSRRSR